MLKFMFPFRLLPWPLSENIKHVKPPARTSGRWLQALSFTRLQALKGYLHVAYEKALYLPLKGGMGKDC